MMDADTDARDLDGKEIAGLEALEEGDGRGGGEGVQFRWERGC